jgi:hypothetical protein
MVNKLDKESSYMIDAKFEQLELDESVAKISSISS